MMSIQELRALGRRTNSSRDAAIAAIALWRTAGPIGAWNRSQVSTAITQADVQTFYEANYHAGGAIVAIAGNVDRDQVMNWITTAFGDWKSNRFASP